MTAAGPEGAHRQAVGRTLRTLRIARGLTQSQLARLIGVSPATLSAIESGATGLTTARAVRIADLLDVPVHDLVVGEHAGGPTVADGPRAFADGSRAVGASAGWRHFAPLGLDAALTGALSSFLEFGYHGATMRMIAERAGLSVPGLYHYYPSKQDMLVALFDLTMTDLQARTVAARAEGTDPVRRFTLIVECLSLYHTHRRELAFVGATEMRSLHPAARERVAAMRRDEQRMVDQEVAHAVRTGAFGTPRQKEAARAVVTMCTALAQWFDRNGPVSAEGIAAQYVDFALGLVQARR